MLYVVTSTAGIVAAFPLSNWITVAGLVTRLIKMVGDGGVTRQSQNVA